MKLSEENLFVIRTIVNYHVLVQLEKKGTITKETFSEIYDGYSEAQKVILGMFLSETNDLLTHLTENISQFYDEHSETQKIILGIFLSETNDLLKHLANNFSDSKKEN